MAEADSFATLLQRARHGDAAALQSIALTYEKDLRIAARVHLGTALRPYLDSMDLVQSVHRSLMVGLRHDKFDVTSPQKLIALALVMVRRKIAHHWRKHRRQRRHDDASLNPLNLLLERSTDDPARTAETRDALGLLWNSITDDERQLLELRLFGFNNVEAARQLGQPAETVRTHLHRLRGRLRDRNVACDWLT